MAGVIADPERCYRAVQSRDRRFDGWFFVAVTSTGIYCRPSCPAVTPKRANVRFFATAAAAQRNGFRACRRCRPDATPGSPEWDRRADLVGRAMRLIADGVVDREGVAGVARRLGYSSRHIHRQLVAEVGAGPIALARAQRAQSARVLIETTDLPFAQVAFGAGFASIRQFNDTVRQVYGRSPTELRRHRRRADARDVAGSGSAGRLRLRLPARPPFGGAGLVGFLAARAVPGLEQVVDGPDGPGLRRSLHLGRGAALVTLTPAGDHVVAELRLDDLRDLPVAVARCRRLFDLDADPVAVAAVLGRDPALAPLVDRHRGIRVPGAVDGFELAVRAVLGQQVSVAGARALTGRVVAALGTPLGDPDAGVTHRFPTPGALAGAPDAALPVPARRRQALRALAEACTEGRLDLDPGTDRAAAVDALRAVPGIGGWTASYVAMRALGDPDVLLASDLGVRRALERLDGPGACRPGPVGPGAARSVAVRDATTTERGAAWRPWRSYATVLLWRTLAQPLGPLGPLGPPRRGGRPRRIRSSVRDARLAFDLMDSTLLIVLVAVVAVVIVAALAVSPLLNKKGDAAIARAKELLGGGRMVEIEPKANGFGTEPASAGGLRGMGCLAVTETDLAFVTWAPQKEFQIERSAITGVETSADDLAGTQKAMIMVTYTAADGSSVVASWRVPDLVLWLTVLGYDFGPEGPPVAAVDDEDDD